MDSIDGPVRRDIVIRTLRKDDLNRIVKIDASFVGRKRTSWFEGKLDRAVSGSDIRISLGAEVDGIVVGALMGSVHYGEYGQAEPVAILDTLLVDKSFERQGIAKRMMDQLLQNLRALHIETLRTEVGWDEQHILAFLAKSGFAPVPRLILERTL